MYKTNKNIVLTHYLLCSVFIVTFAVHLFNVHINELLSEPLSSLAMLIVSTIYAVWGGTLQFRDNKKKLIQYIIGIFVVITIALVAHLFNRNILVVVALFGFLLGFHDFRAAINTPPKH